eukprot:gnl/Dysnectes_brevis/1832_a2102_2559.p1 GENE.gnl/Dysnectes_brevis/1832_a2102_2559~~gnl/Dysnectes_brevis/1832_a2102_2559.p1  ORF type:complete len:918 (-),score=351.25 gnl/Dysnectes_brevis/1832_a2102_2559:102-2798(-)
MIPTPQEAGTESKTDSWSSIFMRQMKVLLKKNFTVSFRHPFVLALEIIVPALLLLTICGNPITSTAEVLHPPSYEFYWWPVNEDGPTFIYAPSGDTFTEAVMGHIMDSYDPPLVKGVDVLNFTDENEAQAWVFDNQDVIGAGFLFDKNQDPVHATLQKIVYTVLYNSTYDQFDMNEVIAVHSVNTMAQWAIAKELAIRQGVEGGEEMGPDDFNVALRYFPDAPTYTLLNTVATGASVVLSLGVVVTYIVSSYQIVSEKQMKLRRSLHTIGLLDSAFYASLTIHLVTIAALQAAVGMIFGLLSGFVYFRAVNIFVNFLIMFSFFLAGGTFSFLVCSFINTVRASVFITFLILIFAFIGGVMAIESRLDAFPENSSTWTWLYWLVFPMNVGQAFWATSDKGMPHIDSQGFPTSPIGFTFADMFDPNAAETSYYSVAFCVMLMLIDSIIYILLAAYFDLVFSSAHGVGLPGYFPFTLDFWGLAKGAPPPQSHLPGYEVPEPMMEWDPDVRTEAKRMLAPLGSEEHSRVVDSAIKVFDMGVIYRRYPWRSHSDKEAVRHLSLAIPNNTVFGLLGPNGAGKTTTLSVLTGSLKPSSGYVSILGLSAVHQRSQVSHYLGYAPQHDVLWPDLTSREHIELFSDLRGINYANDLAQHQADAAAAARAGLAILDDEEDDFGRTMDRAKAADRMVRARLRDVSLSEAIDVPSRSLSGGMRRRLTLAIALLGDPKVIFLDEPSTGLDPSNRRRVWDVIVRAKPNRVLILTTHSMEEADVLADRIGIIAHGALRCVGSSARLKRRYGMGYRLDVDCRFDPVSGESDVMRIKTELVDPFCPEALLIGRTGGHLTLALPRTLPVERLQDFLGRVEAANHIVKDWSVRQSTLEECFNSICVIADMLEKKGTPQ